VVPGQVDGAPLHHSGVNRTPTTQIRVNLVQDAEVTTSKPPPRSCFIFMCIFGAGKRGKQNHEIQ